MKSGVSDCQLSRTMVRAVHRMDSYQLHLKQKHVVPCETMRDDISSGPACCCCVLLILRNYSMHGVSTSFVNFLIPVLCISKSDLGRRIK